MKNITNDDFKHQRGPAYEALARQITECHSHLRFFWDLQGRGSSKPTSNFITNSGPMAVNWPSSFGIGE